LIQSSGRGEVLAKRGRTLDVQRLIELGKWVEGDLQKRTSISLHYSWPIAFFGLNHLLKNNTLEVCGIYNILGVLASGQLALCGIGVGVPELVYGQLGKDRVSEVWVNSPSLNKLRSDIKEHPDGICARCLLYHRCLGSCVAENYHLHKRIPAPFWFCQDAEAVGLFPQTRLST
jgi:radical SAM protein with 4Fe4S-binding SPASM domain